MARIAAQHPETKSEGQIAVIEPLHDYITGTNKTLIYLLFAGSLILLLVASINLASILAARAVSRGGEIVIRVALGAGKKRLFRQFFAEGLILAGIGTAAGVAASFPLVRAIAHLAPQEIPRIGSVSVNGWALSFTLACLIVTTLLFGITPLLLIREPGLHTILEGQQWQYRELATRSKTRAHHDRPGNIRYFGPHRSDRYRRQELPQSSECETGFRRRSSIYLRRILESHELSGSSFAPSFLPRLNRKASGQTRGLSCSERRFCRPLEGLVGWYADYILPGQTSEEARKNPRTTSRSSLHLISRQSGRRLLAGRTFDETDDSTKPLVAIISESVARRMYGTARTRSESTSNSLTALLA